VTPRRGDRRRRSRGQSVIEFTLLLPLAMMILFGLIEFGILFTHAMTIQYAVREGARAGASLANGGGTIGCNSGQSPNWQSVDPLVIAAVERVLQSPGSQVVLAQVTTIVIYKANVTTGADTVGLRNTWRYSLNGGPVPIGTTDRLSFVDTAYPATDGWKACSRSNGGATIDPIGVSVTYNYVFQTPLTAIFRMFGGAGASLTITDRTVMDLNPTS
jgi:Flp pilus assembly protein TadG